MTSLDVLSQLPPSPQEVQENRKNGFGYYMYLPAETQSFSEAIPELEKRAFTELPEILEQLKESHRVLLGGEPGSGKSHLISYLLVDCITNSVPVFALNVHINGGSRSGIDNIMPEIEQFRAKSKEAKGGLLILDNIDFVGYKGRSRGHGESVDYAKAFQPFIDSLFDDDNVYILATSHDEAWREGRWTWSDERIDMPARAVLDTFPVKLDFEGKMALSGLLEVIMKREFEYEQKEGRSNKASLGDATKVMLELQSMNRANFFHANHLDINKFLEHPHQAIQEIDQGRNERRHKT